MTWKFFTNYFFIFNLEAFIFSFLYELRIMLRHSVAILEKIFQNEENDAFDENENNDENLFETFEQNEDSEIEMLQ